MVLDDYQEAAAAAVNWRQDELALDIECLHRPLHGAELLAAPSDVEIVVDMRERTEFDAANLEGLPRLRLLVATGMLNSAIDLDAAGASWSAVLVG